jgi:hypothetical protein
MIVFGMKAVNLLKATHSAGEKIEFYTFAPYRQMQALAF